MKILRFTIWIAAVFAVALLSGIQRSEASSLLLPAYAEDQTADADDQSVQPTLIDHRKRAKRKKRKFKKRQYQRHHRKFHKRYNKRQKKYKSGHRRFHRHYNRPHRRPGIRFEFGPRYYDPWYYEPRYYDPYYYAPRYRTRISCNHAKRLVRNYGYKRVRAYDCRGKVYGFKAWRKGKRYKIRVSSRTGSILSRKRY